MSATLGRWGQGNIAAVPGTVGPLKDERPRRNVGRHPSCPARLPLAERGNPLPVVPVETEK